MLARLVTFNSHKVNFLNLVPYHITEYYQSQWYGPCRACIISEYPWIRLTPGMLERKIIEHFNVGLRHVDWKSHVPLLENIVRDAEKNAQDLFFGSYNYDQLNFLKNFFGNNSLTIGLTYTEKNYDLLLTDIAKKHIYLLHLGNIIPNDQDLEVLKSKTYNQLIEHYKIIFNETNYLPKSCSFSGDYEIPFDDYYHVKKMENHFKNIKLPILDTKKSVYHKWVGLKV